MAEAVSPIRLSSTAELDQFIEGSVGSAVWLFKHSLICPTSSRAYEEFLGFVGPTGGANVAVIEIQRARDVSKEVAARTGVRHESPQVLLIRDGEAIWQASHWSITEEALAEAARVHGAQAGTIGC